MSNTAAARLKWEYFFALAWGSTMYRGLDFGTDTADNPAMKSTTALFEEIIESVESGRTKEPLAAGIN